MKFLKIFYWKIKEFYHSYWSFYNGFIGGGTRAPVASFMLSGSLTFWIYVSDAINDPTFILAQLDSVFMLYMIERHAGRFVAAQVLNEIY